MKGVVLFLFFLFILFSFGEGSKIIPSPRLGLKECEKMKLSKRGEEMKKNNEVIVVRVLTRTKTGLCLGKRSDWRESLPQCLMDMTGLDVFVLNSDLTCSSCSTLSPVNCPTIHEKKVGMLLVIGGAWGAPIDCSTDFRPLSLPNDGFADRNLTVSEVCVVQEKKKFPNLLLSPNTIRLWIPIAGNNNQIWALFEHAQVVPSDTGGEWLFLNDYHFPKFPSEREKEKEAKERATREEQKEKIKEHGEREEEGKEGKEGHKGETVVVAAGEGILARRERRAGGIVGREREKRRGMGSGSGLTYKEDNLFLYISRMDWGKGQKEWINRVQKSQGFQNQTFRFFTSSPYHPSVRDIPGASPNFEFIDKVPREVVHENMTSARGLVHFSLFDRNPRVIYEALAAKIPVFVSIMSMPYRGFECAPSLFIKVADNQLSPKDLKNEFGLFVKNSKNRGLLASRLDKVVRGLSPRTTYQCLCYSLGICGEPCKEGERGIYREFQEVFQESAFAQSGLNLPASCPLGRNLEGITCDKSEFFSCLRWVFWISRKKDQGRTKYFVLFEQTEQTKRFFGEDFESITSKHCYSVEKRTALLGSLRASRKNEKKKMSPRTGSLVERLKIAWLS